MSPLARKAILEARRHDRRSHDWIPVPDAVVGACLMLIAAWLVADHLQYVIGCK